MPPYDFLFLVVVVVFLAGQTLLAVWQHTPWNNEVKWPITAFTTAVAIGIIGGAALSAFPAKDVADWAQAVGILFAGVSVIALFIQIKKDGVRHGTGILMELLRDYYDSDNMRHIRRVSAKDLREHRRLSYPEEMPYNVGVSTVLNFFQTLGLMTNKGLLDPEMVWDKFFDRIRHYYHLTGQFRAQRQKHNPTFWREFERLYYLKLAKINQNKRKLFVPSSYEPSDVEPSDRELEGFFMLEEADSPITEFQQDVGANGMEQHVFRAPTQATLVASSDKQRDLAILDNRQHPYAMLNIVRDDLSGSFQNGEECFLVTDRAGNILARLAVNHDGTPRLESIPVQLSFTGM